MADGDYERREPKTAELKRLERIIADARREKGKQVPKTDEYGIIQSIRPDKEDNDNEDI
ncbi:MAG: hypothetical protein II946_01810 [Kiritimatiellae bacterium]|nr:hypothetical protein [Kiritimatiellia bacterium]